MEKEFTFLEWQQQVVTLLPGNGDAMAENLKPEPEPFPIEAASDFRRGHPHDFFSWSTHPSASTLSLILGDKRDKSETSTWKADLSAMAMAEYESPPSIARSMSEARVKGLPRAAEPKRITRLMSGSSPILPSPVHW